jgi:cytochrome c553
MHMQGTGASIAIVAEPTIVALAVIVVLASMWLATLVICRSVKSCSREAVAAYDLGEQMGRDRGYMEGRRVARPVVVPMPPACPSCHARPEGEFADVR